MQMENVAMDSDYMQENEGVFWCEEEIRRREGEIVIFLPKGSFY